MARICQKQNFRKKSESYEKKIVSVSPTVNSDEKERVHLQNFVLMGRSNIPVESSGNVLIIDPIFEIIEKK